MGVVVSGPSNELLVAEQLAAILRAREDPAASLPERVPADMQDELRSLVELAAALESLAAGESTGPRPEFRAAARQRLLASLNEDVGQGVG